MKILIIQQKMIGDVLTSTILFEALKKKFPEAELHYLIHKHTFPVVENNPFIDKVLLFDPTIEGRPSGFLPFLKKIKKQEYQVVIDVYAKINTAIITAFSGAKKRISYFKRYTSGAYTNTFQPLKTPRTKAGLAIENRMFFLQAVSPDFPLELKPRIFLSEEERNSARLLLQESGISENRALVMISLLGSSAQKTYPLEYMAKVLDFIVEDSSPQLLFNYIPNQIEDAKRLYEYCNPKTRQHIFLDIFGKNLREFIAIASHCDALIGNEGGAINMAKALNIPTFAIFSPQITKENWSVYEDGKQNVSVHLKDYCPEAIDGKPKKELLKNSAHFYEMLKPHLILAELHRFLTINLAAKFENRLPKK